MKMTSNAWLFGTLLGGLLVIMGCAPPLDEPAESPDDDVLGGASSEGADELLTGETAGAQGAPSLQTLGCIGRGSRGCWSNDVWAGR
ncbi:MAG: hypothetical protein MUF34_09555 [Polyangiaceae bacterium]|jgi:hypothetical protein|nr:hypothetical protein [Polyangiaceae bacterium]